MERWKTYADFRRWMVGERRRRNLSQAQLGEMVGLSKVSIRKIELGQTQFPKYETVRSIVAALDSGAETPHNGVASPNRSEHGKERLEGVKLMPVYRWGTRGDPRGDSTRPLPESKEYPAGGATLVGPRGFGLIVSGDTLAGYGIHDRDVAWCNPDELPSPNMPVIAIRDGLEAVVSDGTEEVIGPVVWVTPSGHPPMRPDA
jgi:transcriptional regulator with XRE-family HTH domain